MLCGTYSTDGDVTFNYGGHDYWLIKTDFSGNILWEKTYGGSDDDNQKDFIKTLDNGYIMFGHTYSDDGDVSGFHGGADYWAVKTDSLGNIEWQKCMGGSIGDAAYQIKQIPDSGYVCVGFTASSDGDVTGFNGFYDAWLVKLSSEGEIEWNKCYGGSHIDRAHSISLTNDGGFIIGGLTMSTDGDVLCELHSEYADIWIIKIDSVGNIEWQQCYGGSNWEGFKDIKQIEEGGYIFLGTTNSNDGDVSGFHGTPGTNYNKDLWVVKLDNSGNIEWQKCLGGTQDESASYIELMEDGGYIIGSSTKSNDGDVSGNNSYEGWLDIWLVKLSSDGILEWQKCLGGLMDNSAGGIAIKSPNSFIISGTIDNSNSGDVNCDLHGASDVWLLEIKDTTTNISHNTTINNEINVYPNPARDYVVFEFEYSDSVFESFSTTKISIINIFGEEIARLEANRKKTVWDTRETKNGIYFFHLEIDGTVYNGKIIVSK